MPYDGPDDPLDALHALRGAREGTLRVAMRAFAYDTAAAAAPSLHGHPLTVADLEEQLARDDAERAGEPPEFVDAYAAAARAAAFGVAAFAPWRRLDELERRALRARIGLHVATCVEINRRETFVHLHAITGPGQRARERRGGRAAPLSRRAERGLPPRSEGHR